MNIFNNSDERLESAAAIVDDNTTADDLKAAERAYMEQIQRGEPSSGTAFAYAFCLIRSSKQNVERGIKILEDLAQGQGVKDEPESQRDYMYYLGVANTRIKNYDRALAFLDTLLQVEPKNKQADALKQLIHKRMKNEGILGAAILGGGALIAGAVITGLFAAAVSRRH